MRFAIAATFCLRYQQNATIRGSDITIDLLYVGGGCTWSIMALLVILSAVGIVATRT
jgi:hypothetical protein